MSVSKSKKKPLSQVNKDDKYLKVETNAEWLRQIVNKSFYDDGFYRIIDFYVLHSPCKVSSYSPRSLESMGWKNPWHSSQFRNTFDAVPGFVNDDNLRFHESKNHFLEMWQKTGYSDFYGTERKEFAVFTIAGETNPRMDLLHHIRNAFAHGRFAVKKINQEYYIYLEDVTKVNGIKELCVVARIYLKKSTLLEWLDIFERKSEKAKSLSSLFAESKL